MAIVQVTSREFRAEQARLFGLADSGEQVIISRGKEQAYMLIPVNYSDFMISPELQNRIDEVHQSLRDGECVRCFSKDELNTLLESL